jgi:hypothetical protein
MTLKPPRAMNRSAALTTHFGIGPTPRARYSLRNSPSKSTPGCGSDRGCSGASSSGSLLDATTFDARRLKNSNAALGYPPRSVYLFARGVWVRNVGAYRYLAEVSEKERNGTLMEFSTPQM